MLFTRKTIGEQLLEIEFPAPLRVCFREAGATPQKENAVGVYRGFLFTDFYRNVSIPLAALSVIEQECA
jgi:hypothetical protein